MTLTDVDRAASILASARRIGMRIERLPVGSRPQTDDEALEIQRRVLWLLGEEIGGWKASLPRGDDLFNAPIPASSIYFGSTGPVRVAGGLARVEPEIAFVLGRDLPSGKRECAAEEVRDAVERAHLVLELMGGRLLDPGALPFVEFLADSLDNAGLLVGPELAYPFEGELGAFRVTIDGPDDRLIDVAGRHPNGHPLQGLVWLTNFLGSRGERIRAGQVVTTGSYAGVLEVPVSVPLMIEFEALGRWEAILRPAGE
jgi:2-keto-4-pentenoate hydratase